MLRGQGVIWGLPDRHIFEAASHLDDLLPHADSISSVSKVKDPLCYLLCLHTWIQPA